MRERSNKQPNLNESSKTSFSKKVKKFLENSEKAVTHVLAKMGIASSLVGGTMATEATTATFVPEAVATITTMTPTTSAAVKTITIGTAIALASACDRPDITPPTAEVVNRDVKISGGETLRISGTRVYIGNTPVFRFNDDVSTNLNITVTFNGKSISSGFVFNESGTLSAKATDEARNTSTTVTSKVNTLNKAPSIDLKKSQIDVSKPKVVSIEGNKLIIGGETVATWSDDKTQNCKVSLTLDGKEVKSGDTLKDDGTLVLKITDGDGESSTVNIKLNATNNAPEINLKQSEINAFGGVKVNITDNKLLLGDEEVASRSDDRTENCTVSIKFNGKEIQSGDTISGAGKLSLKVTDSEGKFSDKEITVTNEPIKGLENLKNLNMQVDKEVDLLKGISFPNGVELVKLEIEIDGQRYEVSDPNHYIPQYPGTCNIIFTIRLNSGDTTEVKSDTLTIKGLEYRSPTINNIKPVDILPIIGQVQEGDKECYNHIEHLRLAEATKIRDMMWEYGAGNHSKEEYRGLMSRLNTGMLGENPKKYTNYQVIGNGLAENPSNHAHDEWDILNTLVKHANFIVINPGDTDGCYELYKLCISNPNKINIVGVSIYQNVNKQQYNSGEIENLKKYDAEKNVLILQVGSNIDRDDKDNTIVLNRICQEDLDLPDKHSTYGPASRAHGKNDKSLPRHMLVTIGTNAQGNKNLTGETSSSYSKFPDGFHDKILLAGRAFPHAAAYNNFKIEAERGSGYATSLTNYVNVAMMSICFQLYAEVEDIDELLEMVRSTCLTDYITLDGKTQALQLINHAGFIKKYLMPKDKDIPSSIQPGEIVPLKKGYYKGVLFDIPGAEVKINGKWVAYNKENETQIKSQNPMNLEWRLNGDLVAKYNKDGSVTGKIIAIDDERNGLNLDMEGINVMIEKTAQRSMVDIPSSIRSGETIMLTNGSNKGVIYDIPGAQPYIKGKSWIEYNNENKDLVMNQNLKDLPWRLNGDLAMKYSKDGYIKGTVYAINDRGNTIDQREVIINIEDFVQNSNHGYIAQGYTKTEGNYMKDEGDYKKSEREYRKNEGNYNKNEGRYRKREKGYVKNKGNYKKSEGDYKKYAA